MVCLSADAGGTVRNSGEPIELAFLGGFESCNYRCESRQSSIANTSLLNMRELSDGCENSGWE